MTSRRTHDLQVAAELDEDTLFSRRDCTESVGGGARENVPSRAHGDTFSPVGSPTPSTVRSAGHQGAVPGAGATGPEDDGTPPPRSADIESA